MPRSLRKGPFIDACLYKSLLIKFPIKKTSDFSEKIPPVKESKLGVAKNSEKKSFFSASQPRVFAEKSNLKVDELNATEKKMLETNFSKQFFCEPKVFEKNLNSNIWSRRSMIIPQFIGKRVRLHTGKTFLNIHIREEMVGHKFGEFASTRKRAIHKKKIKK